YSYKPEKKRIFKPYDPGNSNKRQRGQKAVTGQVLVEDAQHPNDAQINPYFESVDSEIMKDYVFDSEIMNMYLRLEHEAQLKSML
ncbi:26641_t:CDS:1, partial [Gigaspora margarita]